MADIWQAQAVLKDWAGQDPGVSKNSSKNLGRKPQEVVGYCSNSSNLKSKPGVFNV